MHAFGKHLNGAMTRRSVRKLNGLTGWRKRKKRPGTERTVLVNTLSLRFPKRILVPTLTMELDFGTL